MQNACFLKVYRRNNKLPTAGKMLSVITFQKSWTLKDLQLSLMLADKSRSYSFSFSTQKLLENSAASLFFSSN